jgi:LPS O-antigen subunit length determinant protein (WzzB/FepE family)
MDGDDCPQRGQPVVQSDEAIDDAAASKSRKKKTRKAKQTPVQARSWPRRVVRSLLALAGLGLVMGVGAVLGRASARA